MYFASSQGAEINRIDLRMCGLAVITCRLRSYRKVLSHTQSYNLGTRKRAWRSAQLEELI
jgi:hypothetical protein